MKPLRWVWGVGCLVAVLAAGCSRGQEDSSSTEKGDGLTVAVSVKTYGDKVEKSEGIAIVDFWAPWCGPCKVIAPYLENIARDYEGRVSIFKVNVDHNQELAERFKIRGIPTLLLYKDGESIDMKVGVAPEADLRKWVEEHLPDSA